MVLSLPRCSYVVALSRPYPLKVLAVSGWRLGTQAACFASIYSVLCEEYQRSDYTHFLAFFVANSFCNSFERFSPAAIWPADIFFAIMARFLRASSSVVLTRCQ